MWSPCFSSHFSIIKWLTFLMIFPLNYWEAAVSAKMRNYMISKVVHCYPKQYIILKQWVSDEFKMFYSTDTKITENKIEQSRWGIWSSLTEQVREYKYKQASKQVNSWVHPHLRYFRMINGSLTARAFWLGHPWIILALPRYWTWSFIITFDTGWVGLICSASSRSHLPWID